MAWTMRLPEDEETQLTRQAEAEGRSKQDIARDAVHLYLMRNRTWDEPMDIPELNLSEDLPDRVHEVLNGNDEAA